MHRKTRRALRRWVGVSGRAGQAMDVETGKRALILDAASRVFVEGGLQVPMAEIARAAGIATGSIYTYFRSKDELVLAIYRRIGEETTAAVVRPDDPRLSPSEALRAYFLRYIDFIWADPIRAALLEYLSNAPVIPIADAEAIFGPLVTYGKRLVGRAHPGAARPLSSELVNSFLRGAIRNTLKRLRSSGKPLTPATRRGLADMCHSAMAGAPQLEPA